MEPAESTEQVEPAKTFTVRIRTQAEVTALGKLAWREHREPEQQLEAMIEKILTAGKATTGAATGAPRGISTGRRGRAPALPAAQAS